VAALISLIFVGNRAGVDLVTVINPSRRLVHQTPTDLQRRDRRCAPRLVVAAEFFLVPSGSESIEIPITLLNRFVETLCLTA
jgi:hypothetical protein